MGCDFSDRVSLLIDGVLSSSDAEQMRKHMTACRVCRQVEQDFLSLRRQIKSYEFNDDPIAQRQTLWKVLASQSVPIWRRKIALPAPVFALLVVALMALGVLSVFMRAASPTSESARRLRGVPAETGANNEAAMMDLSRFDRGERAMVYKERRSEAGADDNNGAKR